MSFALFTAFGLGFLYFISAIPVAMAAGASLWGAAFMAWLGYVAGGGLVIGLGVPLRVWLLKKTGLSLEPNSQKLFWRMWFRYGAFGIALIAPITIGPQVAALLLLALGESPRKILGSLAFGVFPWVLGFSLMIKLGGHVISRS